MGLLLYGETSKRLNFRELSENDFESWKPLFYEKDVAKFLGMDASLSATQLCESWFEKSKWRYDNAKGGMNVLIHKVTGEFIGQCGLLIQEVEGEEKLEIGYSILPKFWGQGYASEAAQKCRDHAFKNGLSNQLISIVHPENKGSSAVAQKNGMKLWKNIPDYKGMPVNIYSIHKSDWNKI